MKFSDVKKAIEKKYDIVLKNHGYRYEEKTKNSDIQRIWHIVSKTIVSFKEIQILALYQVQNFKTFIFLSCSHYIRCESDLQEFFNRVEDIDDLVRHLLKKVR